MSSLKESIRTASEHLHKSLFDITLAGNELGKWRHPAEGEIRGMAVNILRKIDRLDRLYIDLEKEDEKDNKEKART